MSINAIEMPGRYRVQRVQHRREKHEGELDRLGHARQE